MGKMGLRPKKFAYLEMAMVRVACVVLGLLVYRALFFVRAPQAPQVFMVPRGPDYEGLSERRIFPADDPWNTDISSEPVDANSQTLITSIGADKPVHPDFGT